MDFSKLTEFPSLAWDFDNTLVDSPASQLLHDFIKANQDISHYIVTFRTHALVPAIPYDLAKYKSDVSLFKQIITIPTEYWVNYTIDERKRRAGILTGPLTEAEVLYKTWKGMVCQKHSIPVLIDDDMANTAPGCEKYNVILVDPLVLIP
jgi:hypothetical protein